MSRNKPERRQAGTPTRRYGLVVFLLLLAPLSAQAANHYVRAGASGNGSGSDWTNACTEFTGSCAVPALVRGDTYYVADGTYLARTWNRANSGTSAITIQKATGADHGTATGWLDPYGDGQAVFSSGHTFTTGYWDFNGVFEYGFKFDFSEGQSGAVLENATAAVKLRYIDFDGISTTGNYNYTAGTKGIEINSAVDFLASHCALHGGESLIQGGGEGTVIEYCHFYNSRSVSANFHNNVFYLSGGNNGIFRYNRAHDYNDEGLFFTGWSGSPSGWKVYGNVFWSDGGEINPRGIELRQDYSYSNNEFYNNTFVNLNVGGLLNRAPETGHSCTGCVARNNLSYRAGNTLTGMSASNNTDDTTNRFADLANDNFQLAAPLPGESLAAAYNTDLNGRARGADGVWDRGAYEFNSGSTLAHLWVDPTGGTCSRSVTPAAYNDGAACSSLAAAYNAASGGDTIYVKSGSYGDQSVPRRSLGINSVTLAQEPGGGAVTLTSLSIDASYIVADGFAMADGANTAAFSIGMNNGCSATPGNGWPCAFPTRNVTLRNFSANNGFINGDTIVVERGTIGPMEACTNPNAEDGLVILGQGSGVNPSWTPSVNVTIDDVTIHDITNNGCGKHTDGIQGYGYRNLTIRNSRIYNTDSSLILAYSFDNSNPLQVDRIRIENNYFGQVPHPGHGITLGNDTSAPCGTNNLNNIIQNNTFFGNMGADVNCGGGPDAVFRNNIIRNNEACSFGAHDFSYDYNVWPVSGAGSGCSSTLHAKLCDPLFANAGFPNTNADLATNDTCAKDAIASVAGTFPVTDIHGTTRPQGTRADAGAHELISSTLPGSPCDLDANGSTNIVDVQGCVNQAIAVAACGRGDINSDSQCNVVDVQRAVNAALGGQCVTQ